MVFIRATDPVEPVNLIHTMLTDMHEKQLKKTRYISRYLPIQKTCHANLPEIINTGKQLFPPCFEQKDDEGKLIAKKVYIYIYIYNLKKYHDTNTSFYSSLLYVEYVIVTS